MLRPTIALSINSSWNVVNFRAGLVRGLLAKGYRVVALTPVDDYTPLLAALGIEHIALAMQPRGTSPVDDARLFLRYRHALRALRPQAYLGYTIKPNVYGSLAAASLGIPVINNIAGLGEVFGSASLLNRLVRGLYKAALSRSSTVFFQNAEDRALFVNEGIVDPPRTSLLPGSGVDLAHFAQAPLPRACQSTRPLTFLLIARLLAAKGIGDYVAAGRLARARDPGIRLRLLGIPQPGKGAVTPGELASWQGEGIELLAPADDVRPHLADADCLVLPSFYAEGTPRTLLEGAAMGRVLITTDTPGCRDVVIDGHNGFIVPPRDPAALAASMQALARMPGPELAAMGDASRRHAEQTFDEGIIIARYSDALDRALHNKPGA